MSWGNYGAANIIISVIHMRYSPIIAAIVTLYGIIIY